MKTNNITFNNDFTKAYVSKAFQKKAMIYGTQEYTILRAFRAENPDVQICVRKTGSTTNYNLTYAHMEEYIKSQSESENLLKELERIRQESKIQRNPHRYVFNWFKAVFPDYDKASQFQKREEKEEKIILMDNTQKVSA